MTLPTSHALPALLAAVLLVGCASSKSGSSAPREPSQAPAAQPAPPGAYSPAPGAAPPGAPSTPAADVSGAAPTTTPPAPPPAPSQSGAYPPANRSIAIGQASNDVDSSQRELDVAGGDCRNACRALGSMDRATGRLCALAQSNDELRRCSSAKLRVYSARDKVRNTCGTCPDTSVDRSAPVPSQ